MKLGSKLENKGCMRELELYRAHTPCAASSIWLRLHYLAMQFCACAESTWPIRRCGRQAWAIMHYLCQLCPVSNDLKHTEANFFGNFDGSVRLRVAQVTRSSKLAIFVLTTTTDIQNDCFTPCACVRGNYHAQVHTLTHTYMYIHTHTGSPLPALY